MFILSHPSLSYSSNDWGQGRVESKNAISSSFRLTPEQEKQLYIEVKIAFIKQLFSEKRLTQTQMEQLILLQNNKRGVFK